MAKPPTTKPAWTSPTILCTYPRSTSTRPSQTSAGSKRRPCTSTSPTSTPSSPSWSSPPLSHAASRPPFGIFGSGNSLRPGESKFNALMQNNVAGHRPGISTQGCPKFMVVEWCRECMGVHQYDRRRPISKLQEQYPAIDFSEIVSNQDVHWRRDQREREQEVEYRAQVFANWLLNLTEIRIAVVAHSGFIWEFTRLFRDDLSGNVKSELQDGYANCEMRSMVLVDNVGIGQKFGGTDFPGCSKRYFPGQ